MKDHDLYLWSSVVIVTIHDYHRVPSSAVQLSQQVLRQPFLKSIRRPTPLALQAVIEDGTRRISTRPAAGRVDRYFRLTGEGIRAPL
jgi:hypothetical protein